jgi:Tfp pilus assembly protein FimT
MRGSSRAAGYTMIELVVVFGIILTLAMLAITNFAPVTRQWKLSTTGSEIANDLVKARARAIARNRVHWVVFGADGWQVYEDTNGNGGNFVREGGGIDRLVFAGQYKRGIAYMVPTTNPLPQAGANANTVVFDTRGLAANIAPGGQFVGLSDGHGRTRQLRVRYSGMVTRQ